MRTTALLLLLASSAAAAPADVSRVVSGIYSGLTAAVTADVNADGLGGAADVVGALEGRRNPTWRGPYRVGVTQLRFTKTSQTIGQPRVLDTLVWYPTDDDGPVDSTGGIRDAAPKTDIAPLPLLMFSHGSCGFPAQSLFLTPHLASYGVIVAAPPHPGNMLQDFPSCGTQAALVDSFLNRVADIQFVIDSLLAENEDAGSPFFAAIDPERIGMSGHSFGGQTTLRMAIFEPRIIAGLALAPAVIAIGDLIPSIAVPMMIQGGEKDTVTPFEENQAVPYAALHPPKYLVEILNTGHFAFSDNCFPTPDCGPDRLTQDQAHQFVLRYAVPYVLSRVALDGRFDAFLETAATPAGAVLDRVSE